MKRKPVKRNNPNPLETATKANVSKTMAARAEVALMGMCIPIHDQSEVQEMFNYICTALDVKQDNDEWSDVLNKRVRRYTPTNTVAYMTTYRVYGHRCVVFVLKSTATGEDKYPDPFVDDYGTGYPAGFCYVLNLDADDMCSEFGDVFFTEHGGIYRPAITAE